MIQYAHPQNWIRYDPLKVAAALVEAKAAVESLKSAPYQRSWVESLQEMELKREVAGTSRIEGADFTENELEAAMTGSLSELLTRSQRQAHAAVRAYRWIAGLQADQLIDHALLMRIHALMVEGCDDDHCQPGTLRGPDQNVTFGRPRHRGVSGGQECRKCVEELLKQINTTYRAHDALVQALAAHYHLAAMHPFLDGNGRTARALEALMLQKAGLRDSCFIAMSNYYYDEKTAYLSALSDVRKRNHDLTPFLILGLKGVALQSKRLMSEIRTATQKLLFRDVMRGLSERLYSPRKRVITQRQFSILEILLEEQALPAADVLSRIFERYEKLRAPFKAFARDVNALLALGAMTWSPEEGDLFRINLEWPTFITETDFYRITKDLPKAQYTFTSKK